MRLMRNCLVHTIPGTCRIGPAYSNSGEMRLSNFLLWQMSYAEMVVTPVCGRIFASRNSSRRLKIRPASSAVWQIVIMANIEAAQSKAAVFARRLSGASLLYGVLLAGLFVQDANIARAAFGGVITLLGVLGLIEYFDMAIKAGLSTRPQKLPEYYLGRFSLWPSFGRWPSGKWRDRPFVQLLGVLALFP